MKIVFLCRLFVPHIGGVEKHVTEISQQLIKLGHNVSIITERYEDKLPQEEIYHGIYVYRIAAGKENKYKKFRIWKEMQKLQNIVKEADIIHCHDVFFWYLPFRFLYPKKPIYTTFHGYESYPISKGAIRMRKLAEKLSWGNICIGDFIPKWYGTSPTIVSYGAVKKAEKNIKSMEYKKQSAVFIGRLDEQTGALIYAKAIELVKKHYPNFDFTIIGDGIDRIKLEKNFTVLGFQENPEHFFYKYHFAFVSRYLSIIEALAAKRLVFAVYDNPVKEDYLKLAPFAKFIIIEKDPKKLTEKIIYYLNHLKISEKLIEEGFKWASNQTWEKMTNNYLTLWKKNNSTVQKLKSIV
jgi:glycosyltransferase involved in cell wall biosynthesis